MNKELLSKRPVGNIEDRDVEKITSYMNRLLANEYALFTKTLNYHWNITGPRFHSLHKFLEGHYQQLLVVMDDIAERIRILGETPHSTVQEMKSAMELQEKNGRDLSSNEMIQDLFHDNLQIQGSIKECVSHGDLFKMDPGSEDFLVGLLQKHEMMSWTLKSHLD